MLSTYFSAAAYRLDREDDRALWHTVRQDSDASGTSPDTCSECALLQHETRGGYFPRQRPRHCRWLSGRYTATLYLCDDHAAAWGDRDKADLHAHTQSHLQTLTQPDAAAVSEPWGVLVNECGIFARGTATDWWVQTYLRFNTIPGKITTYDSTPSGGLHFICLGDKDDAMFARDHMLHNGIHPKHVKTTTLARANRTVRTQHAKRGSAHTCPACPSHPDGA